MLDEYKYSASIQLWEKILYENSEIEILDVYYLSEGYPRKIHDYYGSDEVEKFRLLIVETIEEKNSNAIIIRLSSDSFAVSHHNDNCERFDVKYKDLTYRMEKTIIRVEKILKSSAEQKSRSN